MKRWFWNCLIGIDQFGNALFGPFLNLLLQPSAAFLAIPKTLSSVFGKNVQAAGSATGLENGNPQFTGLDGVTVRIDGAYSAGTRTIDSLNGD